MERYEVRYPKAAEGLALRKVTHSYFVQAFPHDPRPEDPYYKDFEAYRRKTKATAVCEIGAHRDDFSECFPPLEHWPTGLELHHAHIEFSMQNGIDLAWLERDYPGVSDAKVVGAWVESANNLQWLCERHHRGDAGVHLLTASDYEGIRYVKGLTSAQKA